jgi:hypothetical protein
VTQPSLFEPPKPEKQVTPDNALRERQQFVLELVRNAGRDGLTPDEVGARLCARKGRHGIEERCEWCSANGRDVLTALRKHGKVKSRRSGQWYALEGVVEPKREGIPF